MRLENEWMMGWDSERVIGPSCTIRTEYIENCPSFKQADSSLVLRNQIEDLYLIDGTRAGPARRKICQAVRSVATRRLSLLFDWRPRGSDEGELIWTVSCSCRQQLSRLMEVRRGQQASWQWGTEGLNNITPRWGRVGMEEQKDGEQICCSARRWPSAALRRLQQQPLCLHNPSSFHVTVRTTCGWRAPLNFLFSIWKARKDTLSSIIYTTTDHIYKQIYSGQCIMSGVTLLIRTSAQPTTNFITSKMHGAQLLSADLSQAEVLEAKASMTWKYGHSQGSWCATVRAKPSPSSKEQVACHWRKKIWCCFGFWRFSIRFICLDVY